MTPTLAARAKNFFVVGWAKIGNPPIDLDKEDENMYDKSFWVASLERALKTFAQAFIATVGADAGNIISVSGADAVRLALGAAVLSIFTSVASASFGNRGPSLVGETISVASAPVLKAVAAPKKAAPAKKAPAKKAAAKKTAAKKK